MNFSLFTHVAKYIKRMLAEKSAKIDKKSVMKDIFLEIDISGGYFMVLTTANLIALMGLIMNSPPVIIGAMLVSPLMGPILSTGMAFATGDKTIGLKAVKKISLSIALSVIVAAIASFVSPLADVTPEILARTRPNLFDLFIAFLCGLVGATAICTKRSYITVVPGVAIATAVIPPLSVTGFGIGTGNFQILAGGFLLFFTNFVAIIISTCIVFSLYGFKPVQEAEGAASSVKKRVAFLAFLLLFISIPLIYTLHSSISQIRLRKNIQIALKQEFEREGRSRLVTFTHQPGKGGEIVIYATVTTTGYFKESEIKNSETYLRGSLNSPVVVNLEQVKVQPGGLQEETVKPAIEPARPSIVPAVMQPKIPSEVLRNARNEAVAIVSGSSRKIAEIISPSTVDDFSVAFSGNSETVLVTLAIRRDSPLSAEQQRWLERMLAGELGLPVRLEIRSTPFFPVLLFEKGEIPLSAEMKKTIGTAKVMFAVHPALTFAVESYPDQGKPSAKAVRTAQRRCDEVARYLTEECKIPAGAIRTVIGKPQRDGQPRVRLSVELAEK